MLVMGSGEKSNPNGQLIGSRKNTWPAQGALFVKIVFSYIKDR